MRLSAGGFVGWTMNRSIPRMFSSTRTKISPSAKRVQVSLHSSTPRQRATSSLSGRLPVPATSLKPSDFVS
jgi:hypothetical protein